MITAVILLYAQKLEKSGNTYDRGMVGKNDTKNSQIDLHDEKTISTIY